MRIWISLISVALGIVGCRESQKPLVEPTDAPHGKGPPVESAPAAVPAPPGEPRAIQSEVREEPFVAKAHASEKTAVASPVEFKVTLEAQAGYKVNPEYPIKFTFESGAFVAEPSVLRKEQGKIEEKKAELVGSVRLNGPGPVVVGGRLSFSVCTDERCLIEKRDLSVSIVGS